VADAQPRVLPHDPFEARIQQVAGGGADQPHCGTDTGSGLGLYFVRTVAEKHGGAVELASEPGTFSCFTLRLPLTGLSSPVSMVAAQ